MLAKLRDRARHGHAVPEQAWPETGGSRILVLARRDPETQTVILIMDAAADMASTPSLLTLMNEKPTFARSSGLARSCPGGSYGRRNRQAIAIRDTRVAARLRAVAQAYRIAIERDAAIEPDYTVLRSPERVADREMELE